LAESENAADLVGGVELAEMDPMLASVLTDLSMTSTLDTSLNLGALILEQIGGVARLHKKKVEQAGFAVLKSPDVPSLLIETGFISNPQEAERLSTPAYQDKMARAIRRGIQSWFARQPPPGTLLAWQREQGGREVTVAPGDTLSEIAQRHGVSVAAIKTTNGLSRDVIFVGQTLLIPDD
jgi:N-acetylmuramoyl-L-alanine amidase